MSHKCNSASPFIFMYLFSKLLTVSLEMHLKKYIWVIATSDFSNAAFSYKSENRKSASKNK